MILIAKNKCYFVISEGIKLFPVDKAFE